MISPALWIEDPFTAMDCASYNECKTIRVASTPPSLCMMLLYDSLTAMLASKTKHELVRKSITPNYQTTLACVCLPFLTFLFECYFFLLVQPFELTLRHHCDSHDRENRAQIRAYRSRMMPIHDYFAQN